MRRYQLIVGGTAAGIAGVLSFPTQGSHHLTIPTAGASAATGASGAATTVPASGTGGSGAATATTAPAASSTPKTATSDDQSFRYGDIAVKVTVTGSKITAVSIATINETDGRSANIDSYAVPQLEQQVLSAGSVNINGVSGATFTSQAFVDAVSNALSKLGISG